MQHLLKGTSCSEYGHPHSFFPAQRRCSTGGFLQQSRGGRTKSIKEAGLHVAAHRAGLGCGSVGWHVGNPRARSSSQQITAGSWALGREQVGTKPGMHRIK